MSSIAVITDTDSSLPADVAAKHGIRLVPITINFGEQSFTTGIDIDDLALFERIDREDRLPTTAAPSPGAFAEAYKAAFAAGAGQVLCICVSSEISTTYQAALTARELLPQEDITVVDSRSLSMIQGFMALEAAKDAKAGATIGDIVTHITDVESHSTLYGALSTLKYIAMSGRVGHLAAGMANLLSIKPILAPQAGKLEMLEKVRTRKRAWARMIELLVADVDDSGIDAFALLHVNAKEEAFEFREQLQAVLPTQLPDPIVATLTPGLSVHTGAGIVGAALVKRA
jgi:DegV family protein with EDD domain